MLSIQRRSKIVSKEIQLPNGVVALGIFLVSETSNGLQAQLISIRPIGTDSIFGDNSSQVKALPIIKAKEILASKDCIPSPYTFVSSKDLSFFTSQKTRAPNSII